MLRHSLFAAGEGVVGKGDDQDGGVELVQEPFAGAAFDLIEAGQGFEDKGDVGCGCAHVLEGVALHGGAGVAHYVEKAVEEVDLIGKDIAGDVGDVRRERHPRSRQRVQSAGDIEHGPHGRKLLKELRNRRSRAGASVRGSRRGRP